VTAASGRDRGEGVTVTTGRRERSLACDVLCVGYGLVPNAELPVLLGCATEAGGVAVDERQETTVAGVYCAGEPTGIGGVDLSLVEGEIAGLVAADRATAATSLYRHRDRLRTAAAALERAFVPRAELRDLCTSDTVVCRCEDVTRGALDPRWSPRQAKLYTRARMGPCQGRVCGPALEFLFGWPPDTVRPPLKPILLSTMLAADAGDVASFDPAAARTPS
jgi:NADPH-dependent 2,4-dienoyl-CoA reductase/sulfur reductase-like enzyme